MQVPWAAASARVSAIVQHFYPGVLGGEALAEVLFGQASPAGRLPIMVPTNETQLPAAYLDQSMMAPPGRTHRYFEGTPLFPFGFGLGYSSFGYARLSLARPTLAAGRSAHALDQRLALSVLVTNHGEYQHGAADEVVQVYARPRLARERAPWAPRQMLLGFTRVSLAPGTTREVELNLPATALALLGADGRTLALLEGEYEVHVGGRAPGDALGLPADGAVPPPLRQMLRVVAAAERDDA